MTLPAARGTYALYLSLASPCHLELGASGSHDFPASGYVYLGSAHGPGGLRARLGRHLRGDGRPRWHVDALRRFAGVIGAVYALEPPEAHLARPVNPAVLRLECAWSQALSRLPGFTVPVPGFGASDCRSGCLAHLFAVPAGFSLEMLREVCASNGRVVFIL